MLADWFAQKNVYDTIITDKNNLLQSGSVFYEHAKLTGTLYKHRVIITVDGCITQAIFLMQLPSE